jgi:hypothetical protein
VGDWRGDEICGRSLRREDEGRREGVRVSCSVAVHAAAGARGVHFRAADASFFHHQCALGLYSSSNSSSERVAGASRDKRP